MTVLDRKLITRMVNPQPGGNGGGGGAGGAGAYVLPAASNSELGGIKLGYPTGTGKYYPVQLDSQQRAYVNVPWPDSYDWSDITNKPSIPSVSGSVSGSTLTITINGTSYSLTDTNTWRPVQNNLNSTSTSDSLSAYQGYLLARGSARDNTKLALSGGTMSGSISFNSKDTYNIGSASANLSYLYANSIHPGNNNNLWLYANNNTHIIANGPLIIPINNDVGLSSYGRYALAVGGDPRNNESHIAMDNNEIMAKGSASTSATLYLNAEGGTVCINETAGNCGIGTDNPSYKLHVSGTVGCSNLYSAGYVTALSDARKKRVLGDITLSAEQIAQMPAVRFEWKDPKKPGMFIGTLAQNWREILPEAVHTLDDGTLSFDYQSAAIVALINLADEIVGIKNKLKRYGFK